MCARAFMSVWGYVVCGQDLEFTADVQLDVHLELCLAAHCKAWNLGGLGSELVCL